MIYFVTPDSIIISRFYCNKVKDLTSEIEYLNDWVDGVENSRAKAFHGTAYWCDVNISTLNIQRSWWT
jgi:hypothetical protein